MRRMRFSAFSRGESDYGPCVESICAEDAVQGSLEPLARQHCDACNGLKFKSVIGYEETDTPHFLEMVYALEKGVDFDYCAADEPQFTALNRKEALCHKLLMNEWHKAKEGLSHWDGGWFVVDDEPKWNEIDEKFSRRHEDLMHELYLERQRLVEEYKARRA